MINANFWNQNNQIKIMTSALWLNIASPRVLTNLPTSLPRLLSHISINSSLHQPHPHVNHMTRNYYLRNHKRKKKTSHSFRRFIALRTLCTLHFHLSFCSSPHDLSLIFISQSTSIWLLLQTYNSSCFSAYFIFPFLKYSHIPVLIIVRVYFKIFVDSSSLSNYSNWQK